MSRNFYTTLTVTLTLLAGACGDNGGTSSTSATDGASSTSTGDGTTTTTPTTTTVDPTTTTVDPTTTTVDPTTTTSDDTTTDTTMTGGDPVAQCLEMIDPGDACGECACMNCTDELAACQADEGCTAIRMCAQEAMCGGIDCLGPCGDTINEHGGLAGMSAMLAQTLGGCVADNCGRRCGG
jgi:hypothetical protein